VRFQEREPVSDALEDYINPARQSCYADVRHDIQVAGRARLEGLGGVKPSPHGRRVRLLDDPAPEGKPEDHPEVARRPFGLHRGAVVSFVPSEQVERVLALQAGGCQDRAAPSPSSSALFETFDGALAGTPLQVASQWLGHSSLTSTAQYLNCSDQMASAAAQQVIGTL
jgi:hypothetical protein